MIRDDADESPTGRRQPAAERMGMRRCCSLAPDVTSEEGWPYQVGGAGVLCLPVRSVVTNGYEMMSGLDGLELANEWGET